MKHLNIWWMDVWLMMATKMILDEAEAAEAVAPVLPGHLKLAIRNITRDMYDGRLIAPITLQDLDLDAVNAANINHPLTKAFNRGWLGIIVEEVHLPTLHQYAGLITDINLKAI